MLANSRCYPMLANFADYIRYKRTDADADRAQRIGPITYGDFLGLRQGKIIGPSNRESDGPPLHQA